jgi:hypothetical protein
MWPSLSLTPSTSCLSVSIHLPPWHGLTSGVGSRGDGPNVASKAILNEGFHIYVA